MIGRIQGTLKEKLAQQVLVDVNGLGYEVMVPMTTIFQLPEAGREVILHTHLIVREDAQLLYGFLEKRERELFRILIRINGVGPRLALNILSGIESHDFVNCVLENDVNALVRLPGIGRKTAERLIIEVRDRLKEWDLEAGGEAAYSRADEAPGGQSQLEAESALISLGYKPPEANKAVKQAIRQMEEEGQTPSSEQLIRLALRNMN